MFGLFPLHTAGEWDGWELTNGARCIQLSAKTRFLSNNGKFWPSRRLPPHNYGLGTARPEKLQSTAGDAAKKNRHPGGTRILLQELWTNHLTKTPQGLGWQNAGSRRRCHVAGPVIPYP